MVYKKMKNNEITVEEYTSAEGNGIPTGGHGIKVFCSQISGKFGIIASNGHA
jgi:hypothetical protein